MRNAIHFLTENKICRAVICVLVSGIDIYLAVSLEMWTKSAGNGILAVFAVVGFGAFFLLNASFLYRRKKRLMRHAVFWGALLSAS